MSKLPITGEYPADWDQIGDRVRTEAGHRCIRCGHRYEVGKHKGCKGEWTPCDETCTHAGPLGVMSDLDYAAIEPDTLVNPRMIPQGALPAGAVVAGFRVSRMTVLARWRILTVHHLDGNKANCEWWNLLPLCQRCHLQIQTRVNPEIPYFLEHSDWFRPYVAGFYAHKYEGRTITREEAVARMDELLALERLA
jgi:hypothetical protein